MKRSFAYRSFFHSKFEQQDLTILKLNRKLIVFQQDAHVSSLCAFHHGVHITSLLTQTKVKVTKPEYLVESCGDIGYNQNRSKIYSISIADSNIYLLLIPKKIIFMSSNISNKVIQNTVQGTVEGIQINSTQMPKNSQFKKILAVKTNLFLHGVDRYGFVSGRLFGRARASMILL